MREAGTPPKRAGSHLSGHVEYGGGQLGALVRTAAAALMRGDVVEAHGLRRACPLSPPPPRPPPVLHTPLPAAGGAPRALRLNVCERLAWHGNPTRTPRCASNPTGGWAATRDELSRRYCAVGKANNFVSFGVSVVCGEAGLRAPGRFVRSESGGEGGQAEVAAMPRPQTVKLISQEGFEFTVRATRVRLRASHSRPWLARVAGVGRARQDRS